MDNTISIRNMLGSKIGIAENDFEQAVQQAFQSFSKEHPDWVASLFDEHFLKNAGSPILQRLSEGSMNSLADQLADAWAEQIFKSYSARQKLVREFKPMAVRFIQSVQKALHSTS